MKKSYIPVIAILLAGCTNTVTDTPTDTAAVTTVPSVTSAVTDSTDMTTVTASETTQTAEDEKQSFAGRAEGRYYCNINGGLGEERLKIEINSFGGNLYAMCSLGGDTDKPPQEDGDYAYSFWTAELIPQEPGAYLTDADRCETGVLCFSDMSNAGRYWSAPDTGYVSLTDDGIVFEGIDLVFDSKDNDSLRTELLRYEDSISDVSDDTASYDELYGLWKTSDGGFVRFDNDNTMTAYRKEPGREVQFREESFRAEDGSISLYTSPDGSPEEIRYALDADTLTLFQDDGEIEYIRADESDIPLVALADADEINSRKSGMTVTDADGNERSVMLQFVACTDIENNGGYFVRLGAMIFYRGSDKSLLDRNYSYGEFLRDMPSKQGSPVYWYDTRNGESGMAFDDNGFGPLYYMNGMFYTTTGAYSYEEAAGYNEDEIDTYAPHIRRAYPDGSCAENALGRGNDIHMFNTSSYIDSIADDGSCMLIHEYHVIPEDEMRDDGIRYSSDTFLYDGSAFVHDIPLGESESFEGAQFDGGYMALVKYDYENEVFVFTEFNTSDGTETNLGTSEYIGEAAEYGVCISDQIVFDGGDIYFSVAGLIGDVGYPEDYLIYKAKRGAENSIEKVWQGMPDGYEDYLPYMSIEKGDIIFYERPLYRAGLSERTHGDLICCDPKPRVLIKDFETKDIYEQYGYSLEAGDTVRVLQTAEYIDGEVYVITADCTYEPDTDSGMIYDYSVQRISYIRITPDGKQTVMDEVKR